MVIIIVIIFNTASLEHALLATPIIPTDLEVQCSIVPIGNKLSDGSLPICSLG